MLKKIAQGLVIGLVLYFWGVYLYRSWSELAAYQWEVNYTFLFLAYIFSSLSSFGLGFIWRWLIAKMGWRLDLGLALRIWFSSMFTRYAPGKVWHVVGRVYLSRQEGVSGADAFLSMALEQALAFLATIIIFLFSLIFWVEGRSMAESWPLILLIPLLLALVHPRLFAPLLNFGLRILRRPEVELTLQYRELLIFLVYYLAPALLNGLALYFVLRSLYPLALERLPMVVGAASLAWLVGYLSFLVPAGLGVREGILVILLSSCSPLPVATATSLLSRILITIAEGMWVMITNLWAGQGLVRPAKEGRG